MRKMFNSFKKGGKEEVGGRDEKLPGGNGIDISRRTFVGLTLAGALKAVAPRSAFAQTPKDNKKPANLNGPETQPLLPRRPDKMLLDQISQNGALIIEEKELNEIRAYYKADYSSPAGQKILDATLQRLEVKIKRPPDNIEKSYLGHLQDIFRQRNVPQWCIYLAIVESKFNPETAEKGGFAKGKGIFQISEQMALKSGLLVKKDGKVVKDDRGDVFKSAEFVASMIADNFRRMKKAYSILDHLAWRLAVHAVNGGFAWQYLSKTRSEDGEFSYIGFMKYMETRMNDRLSGPLTYTVKKKDTLLAIVAKYGSTLEVLEQANPQPEPKKDKGKSPSPFALKAGMKLIIPPLTKEQYMKNSQAGFMRLDQMWVNVRYGPELESLLKVLVERKHLQEKDLPGY